MSTTAKIAAKGCNSTGITEDLANTLHAQLGKTIVAVVEIRSESRGENLKGDETVALAITNIEVAPNDLTADHLRDLARSFHYERKVHEDGPTLTGNDGPEPKIADVVAAGQQHRPHPYLASGLAVDNAACDICGQVEDTTIHHDRARMTDPFAVLTDDDEGDPSDDDSSEDEGDPLPAA